MGATDATWVRGAGASAGDGLLVRRDSPIHLLPSHTKLVALVAFVLVVVATPAGAWGAFAAYGVLLAGVLALSRVPGAVVARRLLVETPFVVFALLIPFVAAGPDVHLGPVGLSRAGLVAGGTLLAKATLGVLAAIVLAATTAPRELLSGLDRLRLPRAFVAILAFMIRYVTVAADDLSRARVARESRGYQGGRLGHLAAVAGGVGLLFVRSYERGERIHHAMVARGYTGRMPAMADGGASTAQWAACSLLPLAAGLVLATHAVAAA